ncbi:MAG: hypothetical protein ACFHX7_06260 [Pseudomonadota bacterium]
MDSDQRLEVVSNWPGDLQIVLDGHHLAIGCVNEAGSSLPTLFMLAPPAGAPDNAMAAIAEWREQTRALIDAWQAFEGPALMLNLTSLRQAPEACLLLINENLLLETPAEQLELDAPGGDAVWALVLDSLLKTDLETLQVQEEAMALCTPVSGQEGLELEATAELAKAAVEALGSSKGSATAQTTKLDELASENELLLLQLHQVQEELEKHYLAAQDQEKEAQVQAQRAETAAATIAARDKELSTLKAALAAKESESKGLGEKLRASEQQLKALAEQHQKALAAASTAAEADKARALAGANAAQQQAMEQLKAAHTAAMAELRTSSNNEKQNLAASLDAVKKQHTTINAENEELRQDNELLLLQLHQVQEELERYYLQFSEMQTYAELDSPAEQVKSIKPLRMGEVRDFMKHLFDRAYYFQQAGEMRFPQLHYRLSGWKAGYEPHPLFDTDFYLSQVGLTLDTVDMPPLLHYLRIGVRLNVSPHPEFDTRWYKSQYPDVASSPIPMLIHFSAHGWHEGRRPNRDFDCAWYLREYPDVAELGMNPLAHYVLHGKAEGRRRNASEA